MYFCRYLLLTEKKKPTQVIITCLFCKKHELSETVCGLNGALREPPSLSEKPLEPQSDVFPILVLHCLNTAASDSINNQQIIL